MAAWAPAHGVISPEVGIVDVRQEFSGALPSVLLCFLLSVPESHVFTLYCFVLMSVCCVISGQADSVNLPRAGSTGGLRRKWGLEGAWR